MEKENTMAYYNALKCVLWLVDMETSKRESGSCVGKEEAKSCTMSI